MKKFLLLLVFSGSVAMSNAQLNNTVEVTNEVKPVVTDVKKVDVPTKAAETKVKHYTMEYAVEGQTLNNYAPESLGNYESEEVRKGNKKGYVHMAGGVQGQLDAQAAYQFDITENDALTADLSLKGFNGKARENKYLGVKDWKTRDYQNRAALKYNHRLDNGADIFVKGAWQNRLYNYMEGYDTTDKQHDVMMDASAGFTTLEFGNFSIEGSAGVDLFNQQYRTTLNDKLGETLVHADADMQYEFSDAHSVGLGVGFFHSAYKNKDLKGITRLRFTPHYLYSNSVVDLQLGLFVSTKGNVAPDVSFTYYLNPKSSVYVEVTGEEEDNTFRLFSATHPYFAIETPDEGEKKKMEAAFYQVEATIGYRFKDFYGFGGNIAFSYEQGKDAISLEWLMPDRFGREVALADFDTYRGFTIDADFSYAYEDILKLEAKNQFYFEKWKDEELGRWISGNYTKPVFSMDWKADVKLMKGFYLGLDWQYDLFHQEDIGTEDDPQYKRPAIVNFGASLRYTLPIKQPLTLFVKGDNLFNRNYDRYYCYRNIGASFLGGFALSF